MFTVKCGEKCDVRHAEDHKYPDLNPHTFVVVPCEARENPGTRRHGIMKERAASTISNDHLH